eukprot:TRINITY_DN8880_c0_g2_i1.p1 TRINITY_DN8880_c0_g2~~TRINITY_DN8880_c0_g2_i1.p1  ORF type:complete len:107 (+),score=11.14 TRINITY_DN8880_c0_g2_i1:33-323(+)
MVKITECLKKRKFIWGKEAEKALLSLRRGCVLHLFWLKQFEKLCEVECVACRVRMGVILSQDGRPMEFSSQKLSDPKSKWSSYDQDFYAVVRASKH